MNTAGIAMQFSTIDTGHVSHISLVVGKAKEVAIAKFPL